MTNGIVKLSESRQQPARTILITAAVVIVLRILFFVFGLIFSSSFLPDLFDHAINFRIVFSLDHYSGNVFQNFAIPENVFDFHLITSHSVANNSSRLMSTPSEFLISIASLNVSSVSPRILEYSPERPIPVSFDKSVMFILFRASSAFKFGYIRTPPFVFSFVSLFCFCFFVNHKFNNRRIFEKIQYIFLYFRKLCYIYTKIISEYSQNFVVN